NYPAGKHPNRLDKARQALESVLRRLPKGTTVSLRVFGQTENQGDITVLWDKIRWDPDPTSDVYQERMKRVMDLKAEYETPLVRAIKAAKNDFPQNFQGFKTLVVLTDGMDSEVKDQSPAIIEKEFAGGDILLNIVGFELEASEEEKKTKAKLEEVLKKLGGRFY